MTIPEEPLRPWTARSATSVQMSGAAAQASEAPQ
jgi:hypothetical protein